MATCQQFRTRDCTALDCYLHVTTQPIIEKSNRMRFGCFHASYTELDRQLSSANLCRWSNEWWRLHDFNWKGGMKNYELMLPPYNATELSEAFQFPCSELDGFGFEKSAVPLTSGVKRSDKQSVLVFPLTAEKKLLFELVPQVMV